ncbi:MAG: queuosine precursor transporter [Paracoccaceae bacterium]
MNRRLLPGILAMAIIVVASNILVQHLYGKWLTYGAFTYPLAFLVTDLTNRLQGPSAARRVVVAGFVAGLICSLIGSQIQGEFGPLVTLRVAIGSGLAFLNGQLLDIFVFNRYRNTGWWKAPFFSTIIGSTCDSIIFFMIAFAGFLTFLEPASDVSWAGKMLPLLDQGPVVPLWVSLATADWMVKLAIAVIALIPFRVIVANFTKRVA